MALGTRTAWRVICFGLLLVSASDVMAQRSPPRRPEPDLKNEQYGPHPRHVLDLWQADSETPTPLVVYIHGGGFHAGSKENLPGFLLGLLNDGVSDMAINYRLSPEVHMPDHYLDCARAIQYARWKAKEWNLAPERVAAAGGSAGAGTSLWIGFHDDLADPDNEDPVLRQSTQLKCMAVVGAQSTYDPHVIRELVGEAAAKHPALPGFYGIGFDEIDTPEAKEKFRIASPITYLTKGDPPVYALYYEPRGPLPDNAFPGQGIHHINFGIKLKEAMDEEESNVSSAIWMKNRTPPLH